MAKTWQRIKFCTQIINICVIIIQNTWLYIILFIINFV